MNKAELAPGAFTISDVLSPAECEEIIRRAESIGFEAAALNTVDGPRVEQGVRNNDRVILDDQDMARQLWERLAQYVPPMWAGRQALGLNERFRFYRYKPGQKFSWHVDGAFQRENGEISCLTVLIYLNEGYGGGATQFHHLAVAGKTGMALVFEHILPHQGAELAEGVKYVLRSDVMFGRIGCFKY